MLSVEYLIRRHEALRVNDLNAKVENASDQNAKVENASDQNAQKCVHGIFSKNNISLISSLDPS